MKREFIVLGVCLLSLSSCAGHLPLIGYGPNGEIASAMISESKYEQMLAETLVTVQESVLPPLNDASTQNPKWEVSSVSVGVGLSASVGFGPFSASIRPRIHATFTKQDPPTDHL